MFGEVDGVAHGTALPIGDQGFQQHTYVEEGYDSDVAVDPGGKLIALPAPATASIPESTCSTSMDGRYEIDRRRRRQRVSDLQPRWKTNRLLLDPQRDVEHLCDGLPRAKRRSDHHGINQCVHPSYSPDGGRLVYCALGQRSNEWEIWTVNLTTGERRQIGYGLFPSWSPQRCRANRISAGPAARLSLVQLVDAGFG